MRRRLGLWIAVLLMAFAASAQEAEAPIDVALLEITGPIGPATVDYVSRNMEEAVERGASAIVLRLDTPGGLVDSTREIIKEILASPVPVIGFVGPRGARAASAGTYIMYATHFAAMAPATNMGAATPVQMGGAPAPAPQPGGDEGGDGEDGDNGTGEPGSAMERKVVNDMVAYIRSLAETRGRNADWAEEAVRTGASLSAEAALERDVIEATARDVQALLDEADGREVTIDGETVTLATSGAEVTTLAPDWRTQFLQTITNPNVAYILMLVGIYGIIFEFYNPGIVFSGVIGVICLILALFSFQVLPVNFAGFGLILVGIALMVAEMFAPSFGILGIGGIAAFTIGSIILFDTDVPGFEIAMELVGGVAFTASILLMATIVWLTRSQRRAVVSGSEGMVGERARVVDWSGERGRVRLHGEIWNARGPDGLEEGQWVEVEGIKGLIAEVRRRENAS